MIEEVKGSGSRGVGGRKEAERLMRASAACVLTLRYREVFVSSPGLVLCPGLRVEEYFCMCLAVGVAYSLREVKVERDRHVCPCVRVLRGVSCVGRLEMECRCGRAVLPSTIATEKVSFTKLRKTVALGGHPGAAWLAETALRRGAARATRRVLGLAGTTMCRPPLSHRAIVSALD